MDIPGTRQPGRSSFPGRGRNQRPGLPYPPALLPPNLKVHRVPGPSGESATSSQCLIPCGHLRDPGPGAGLLQHGVTQPSLPAPSLCLLCSCFLASAPSPESRCRDFRGPRADLRGFGGTPVLCHLLFVPGSCAWHPHLESGQGRLCSQPRLAGPPAAVPGVQPGLCLSGTSQGLLFCSLQAPLPPSAGRLLRSSGPKCHQLAGEGGGSAG